MTPMRSCAWIALALAAAACQGEARSAPREDNPRPPPIDCAQVGERLAAVDPAQARAQLVATYRASCERAQVTHHERACLLQTHDLDAAAACAPRMFPERSPQVATRGGSDCAAVAAKIWSVLQSAQPGLSSDPNTVRWLRVVVDTMQRSCEQDAWPESLKRCALAATPKDLQGQACQGHMTPELKAKLEKRVTEALQRAMQQQP